jgi:hypothetical protein
VNPENMKLFLESSILAPILELTVHRVLVNRLAILVAGISLNLWLQMYRNYW